jgi:hypothetical protein
VRMIPYAVMVWLIERMIVHILSFLFGTGISLPTPIRSGARLDHASCSRLAQVGINLIRYGGSALSFPRNHSTGSRTIDVSKSHE